MKFFSVDGKFYRALSGFWDAVKLNFMWLLFSLPIITIGSATIAAFSVTLKIVDNSEGHVVRQFLKAFKENWKQGIPMGLIILIAVYAVYLNFQLFNNLDDNPIVFLIAAVIIVFFGLVHITYAFPVIARYENNFIQAFKKSKSIAFKYFFQTILLWLFVGFLVLVFNWNWILIALGVLVGPVTVFLAISSFSMRFFRKIEKDALSY